MVYLAGDNNLSDEMIWALKEIYRVGPPPGVAVTIQFDPLAPSVGPRFYAPDTKLNDVDGVFAMFHDRQLGEADTGDPDTLVEFVVQSIGKASADNYMLVLSGHGSGVEGDFLSDANSKQVGMPGSLTVPDLRHIFPRLEKELGPEFLLKREGRPVLDILGMDSCLMSMGEICSEIRGQVSYMVGSEGFVPNTGWPYYRIFQRMKELYETRGRHAQPSELASELVDVYMNYYADFADANFSVDMTACRMDAGAVDSLEAAVRDFAEYYDRQTDRTWRATIDDLLVLAHWRAQSYKWEHYTDLADFAQARGRRLQRSREARRVARFRRPARPHDGYRERRQGDGRAERLLGSAISVLAGAVGVLPLVTPSPLGGLPVHEVCDTDGVGQVPRRIRRRHAAARAQTRQRTRSAARRSRRSSCPASRPLPPGASATCRRSASMAR